jgi:hypothetical protein
MDVAIPHLDFVGRDFKVTVGTLSGARIWIDGKRSSKDGRVYLVRDNAGRERRVRLRPTLDIVPKVQIDDEEPIELLPRLAWYELVWTAWPVILVGFGGAIGGGLGALAAVVNVRVFRSSVSPLVRYALTLAIGLAAVMVYLLVAGLIQTLARGE